MPKPLPLQSINHVSFDVCGLGSEYGVLYAMYLDSSGFVVRTSRWRRASGCTTMVCNFT